MTRTGQSYRRDIAIAVGWAGPTGKPKKGRRTAEVKGVALVVVGGKMGLKENPEFPVVAEGAGAALVVVNCAGGIVIGRPKKGATIVEGAAGLASVPGLTGRPSKEESWGSLSRIRFSDLRLRGRNRLALD